MGRSRICRDVTTWETSVLVSSMTGASACTSTWVAEPETFRTGFRVTVSPTVTVRFLKSTVEKPVRETETW